MTKPLEIQSYSEWNLFTRQERPLMIAGPCSAESEEQLFNTATQLKNNGNLEPVRIVLKESE